MKVTEFLLDTVNKLRSTTSTNEKVSILESAFKHEHGEILKQVLIAVYSPYITFGVKSIPKVEPSTVHLNEIHEWFISLIVSLEHRIITGNKAKESIQSFMSLCTAEEQELYSCILQKNLKCGVNTKLINKACPKLIPIHSCQLATTVEYDTIQNKTFKVPSDIALQPKIDGFRCQLFVYEDRVEMYTRNGKTITGYTDIEKEALQYLKPNFVYDGEITTEETIKHLLSASTEAETSRKYFQDTMKYVTAKMDNKDGVLNIFDCVPIEDWKNNSTALTFYDRYNTLTKIMNSLPTKHLYLVETIGVALSDIHYTKVYETIEFYLHKYVSMGYEGLIIRNLNSTYDWKRSKALYKLKLFKDIDLLVTKIVEGDGKYKNSLGAVVVDYKGNQVNVGSGFTDEQRTYYWNNPNEILNHTIEIRYQSESENQNGSKSLSFPTFQCVRVDK